MTYTITADMVLKERADEMMKHDDEDDDEEDDEIIEVELQEKQKITLRQKRRDDRERFETQILDTSQLNFSSDGSESPLSARRTLSSAFTASTDHLQAVLKEANVVIDSLSSTDRREEFLLDEGASDCISLVSNDDEDLSIKAVTAQLKFI